VESLEKSNPKVLKALFNLGLVDYIAMDIKAPLEDYAKIAGRQVPAGRIKQSIDLIMKSRIGYEFRTTVIRPGVSYDDLRIIIKEIRGAEKYILQRFVPAKVVDEKWKEASTYSAQELVQLAQEFEQYVDYCVVR
jgi:pyruvate formate lyase activating enzyme